MKNKILTIELVPSSSWNNNLRTLLGREKWNKIRSKVFDQWGKKCAICNRITNRLDCHEVWEFYESSCLQNLTDIIPLCRQCHAVKHLGLAELQSYQGITKFDNLIRHYMKVNKCTRQNFEQDRKKAFEVFEKRSKISWKLAVKGINLE